MPEDSTAALARNSDPSTSHQAAKALNGDPIKGIQLQVLNAIISAGAGGATNHDLCRMTGLEWKTCTPRVRPLIRMGLVRDSGIRRRDMVTDKQCVVWVAASEFERDAIIAQEKLRMELKAAAPKKVSKLEQAQAVIRDSMSYLKNVQTLGERELSITHGIHRPTIQRNLEILRSLIKRAEELI